MSGIQLISRSNGTAFPIDEPRWHDGQLGLLDLAYQPTFDPEALPPRDFSLWRYRQVLPLPATAPRVSMNEGLTPLVALEMGRHRVGFKLDYLFPSGSYKDRGATLLMSYAQHLGVRQVVQDSSGNAGCAVAHYAALAGIGCEIFVPGDTSPAKLVQIRAMGARISLVPGSREDTAQAAMTAADDTFYASHVWQPWFFHGTKTFIYEVLEQRDWRAPDTVILPAGNGTLLLGVFIGLQELKQAGVIDRLPRLVGVQAAHCAPLYEAFRQGLAQPVPAATQPTVAEGIAIAVPRRGPQMLDYVRQTNGLFLAVEEGEIAAAQAFVSQRGFFIEPTSAAVVAGVQQYLAQHAQPDEDVVSVMTGHGLKSVKQGGQ